MELLFERFLSEERGEWPDIDLDLPSGDKREKAILQPVGPAKQKYPVLKANCFHDTDKAFVRSNLRPITSKARQNLHRLRLGLGWGWVEKPIQQTPS